MLKLIQSIRKPPTPPSNRHGGRERPRLTAADIDAIIEEEMDDGEHEDPEKMRLYEIAIEDEWDNG